MFSAMFYFISILIVMKWMENKCSLEDSKHIFNNLKIYKLLEEMLGSKIKYTWFVVNGLKHTKTLVCPFKTMMKALDNVFLKIRWGDVIWITQEMQQQME